MVILYINTLGGNHVIIILLLMLTVSMPITCSEQRRAQTPQPRTPQPKTQLDTSLYQPTDENRRPLTPTPPHSGKSSSCLTAFRSNSPSNSSQSAIIQFNNLQKLPLNPKKTYKNATSNTSPRVEKNHTTTILFDPSYPLRPEDINLVLNGKAQLVLQALDEESPTKLVCVGLIIKESTTIRIPAPTQRH